MINPDGEIAGTYRKIHLFGFDVGEAATLTSGTQLLTLESPLGITGSATCYDLRFPELFRALQGAGAQSFVIASGWPTVRLKTWRGYWAVIKWDYRPELNLEALRWWWILGDTSSLKPLRIRSAC